MTTASPSPGTERARAVVRAKVAMAVALGRRAGEGSQDPAGIAAALAEGMPALADQAALEGRRRAAPTIGLLLGVRGPLIAAAARGLRSATRHDRPATLLDIADHLVREGPLELHWLAHDLLGRAIAIEPERAWQLVRREARAAADWVTVDSLARVAGRGILAEPYRWAELEQLVYSPSRWERRLAGSTVATIPFVDRRAGRTPETARRGLGIVGDLIGDREPDVQKSLSWALRSLLLVDAGAVIAFLERAAAEAAADDDGHRARVVRDALANLPADTALRLRAALAGVRRRPATPSTSRAAVTAADFLGLGVGVPPAERRTIDRN